MERQTQGLTAKAIPQLGRRNMSFLRIVDKIAGSLRGLSRSALYGARIAGRWPTTRRRLLAWLVLPTLAACAAGRHYHADADTFTELLGRGPESVRSCSLIGTAEGRAYLTVWSNLPGWLGGGDHIYSVPLEELPPDLAQQIRAGRIPWAR